jgi:hypothetical protein
MWAIYLLSSIYYQQEMVDIRIGMPLHLLQKAELLDFFNGAGNDYFVVRGAVLCCDLPLESIHPSRFSLYSQIDSRPVIFLICCCLKYRMSALSSI